MAKTCTHCGSAVGFWSGLSGKTLCTTCYPTVTESLRRWESALDACLVDRVLTESEEEALESLAQQLSLTKSDLSRLSAKLYRARVMSNALMGRAEPVQAAMNLKRNETCFFASAATLLEERTTRQYVSGSRGVSIRIAKGLSYRVGASRGYYVPVSHVVPVCSGQFFVTNKRCIFTGSRKTIAVDLDDLISFDSFDDGMQLHHGKSRELQVFQFPDGDYAAAVLSGLLTPVQPTEVRTSFDPNALAPRRERRRGPLSVLLQVVTAAALLLFAPLGVILAWWLKLWSIPFRIVVSVAAIGFFIYVVSRPDTKDNAEQTPAATVAPATRSGSDVLVAQETPEQRKARHREIVQQGVGAASDVIASKQKCSSLKPDNDAWRAISAAWRLLRQAESTDPEFAKAQKLANQLESCRQQSRAECVRVQMALTGPKGQNGVSPAQRCDDTMRETWDLGSPLVLK